MTTNPKEIPYYQPLPKYSRCGSKQTVRSSAHNFLCGVLVCLASLIAPSYTKAMQEHDPDLKNEASDVFPIEIWEEILSNLKTNELIDAKKISQQLKDVSCKIMDKTCKQENIYKEYYNSNDEEKKEVCHKINYMCKISGNDGWKEFLIKKLETIEIHNFPAESDEEKIMKSAIKAILTNKENDKKEFVDNYLNSISLSKENKELLKMMRKLKPLFEELLHR